VAPCASGLAVQASASWSVVVQVAGGATHADAHACACVVGVAVAAQYASYCDVQTARPTDVALLVLALV